MTHKDSPPDPDEIGTPDNPGGPGRTEVLPEPTEKEIYIPSIPDDEIPGEKK